MTRSRLRPGAVLLLCILATAIALTVTVAAWFVIRGDGGPGADASDPELVALGATVYGEHCAVCHGANLEGEPDWQRRKADGTLPAPPHDETGHTWHHGDRLLFDYTKLGGEEALAMRGVAGFESGMPGFGHVLGDDEIRVILAFIKSTWPEDIRRHQQRLTRQEAASAPRE